MPWSATVPACPLDPLRLSFLLFLFRRLVFPAYPALTRKTLRLTPPL